MPTARRRPPLPRRPLSPCPSRLLRSPRARSPAAAINAAVRTSRADAVMVCIDGARMLSVITFEVGGQYLALEAARVVEVSATRPVRRVPHRTSPVFAGLVNVQGKLEPCFSLGAMLGLPPTVEPGEPRLLVVGDDVRRCAFHVYRPALQEADSGGVGAPPATLSAALESHVRGILRLGDRPWSWLDADRLLTSLERRLA